MAEAVAQTRPAEIADFLAGVDFAALDAAGKATLARDIVARWPNVTRHDLEAGFQIAALEAAAQLAGAVADRCDAAAVAVARATAANPMPA